MSEELEPNSEKSPIDLNKQEPVSKPIETPVSSTPTPPPFAPFGGNMGMHNLPNSTISLVLGVLSIPACCCYGIFGLIFGILAWVLSSSDIKNYQLNPALYSVSSVKNAKAGKICGIIGTILSALYLLIIIALIAVFGFAALRDPEMMKELLQEKGY